MFLNYKKKKKIYFSKMHGLGNDFMVIESIKQDFILTKSIIENLSIEILELVLINYY